MKHLSRFFMVCLILAGLMAACAPTPTPESNFPTGKFVSPESRFDGKEFKADGTWRAFGMGETLATGTYSVKGDIYTELTNDEGCPAPMSYRFTFDGTNLTFQLTEESKADTCDPRREGFDNKTYVLVTEDTKSTAPSTALPELKIDAADYSYQVAPATIRAGWTRVLLTNSGAEAHHVQFLHLKDGVTAEQFEAALAQGEGPALAMTAQVGGVGAVHPGGSASAVLNLPAGDYVILSFIPSPADGTPQFAKGMITSFSVQAASGDTVAEPAANLTVRLADFAFDMPETLPAGLLMVQVVNDGPETHEFNILRLEEGKTVQDVLSFLGGAGGPPPFAPIGGMNGLDIGLTGYAEINLAPGRYVAICNIPSPKAEGHAHFTLGMVREFTVK
jgi:hypothetical protein